ncbi:MAG: hypothetical protein ACR2FV_13355 [Ornithinimicrobium sp.]
MVGRVGDEDLVRTDPLWTHLGVTTLLWIFIPLAIGVRRALRAEVK